MQCCTGVTQHAAEGKYAGGPPTSERRSRPFMSRQEVGAKVEVMEGKTSAWREGEFDMWLQLKLSAFSQDLVARLQERVCTHLVDHQKATLEALEEHLTAHKRAHLEELSGKLSHSLASHCLASRQPVERPPCASVGSAVPGLDSITVSEACGGCHPTGQERDREVAAGSHHISEAGSDHHGQYRSARMKKLMSRGEEITQVTSRVQRLVRTAYFEFACTALILLNTVSMAVEVQYIGCQVGHDLNHPSCQEKPDVAWPWAADAFIISSMVFCFLFLVEFALRLIAMRRKALTSGWMWFDGILVTISSVDVISRSVGSMGAIGVNPAMMRLARFARMIRMMKVLKSREGFSSLFLLIKSIQASAHALLWSILLLIFTMTSIGILINQLTYDYLADSSLSIAERREVFDYYGTYTRTLITMFELTIGNWAPPSRLLMSKVNEWWGLFIVIYRGVFCFALVNVTGAVFITETNRVAAGDDEVLMMRKERTARANARKLQDVFSELDTTGDGQVTWVEFNQALNDTAMKQYLGALELDVGDCHELFRLLDDGDGQVNRDEFVQGISTLRGQAKNIDLLLLLKIVRRMAGKIDTVHQKVHRVHETLADPATS